MPATLNKVRIILLDFNKALCERWQQYIDDFTRSPYGLADLTWFDAPLDLHVHNGSFDSLSEELKMKPETHFRLQFHKEVARSSRVTTILSPGNSIGYMGGGFDKALAGLFSKEWKDTERGVQSQLLDLYKGYLTPGHANLIEYNSDSFYRDSKAWNLLSANSILHMPTMRVPRPLRTVSDLELYRYIFDCTWELLCTVNKANIQTLKYSDERHAVIDSIILTGIGTGYGGVPLDIVAKSMVAAVVIFTNHRLLRVQKSIYCLKYLGEDYEKLMDVDELKVDINRDAFDIEKDSLDKLF